MCTDLPRFLRLSLGAMWLLLALGGSPRNLGLWNKEVLFSPQSHFYVVHFESHGDLRVHISLSLSTLATMIAVQQTIPTKPQLVAYPTENVCFNVNVYM